MHRNTIVVVILILLFAFVTVEARAATVAESNNRAGGKMILTDLKCTSQRGLIAYSHMPDRPTLLGCWFIDDNYVFIEWSDGDLRTYQFSSFTIIKK